jgi:hypothetical protein
MYQSNFKNEKNTTKTVFNAGWHNWHVDTIESKTSKSGNPMFAVGFSNIDTCQTITSYLLAVEGKQWQLSQFIKACGVVVDQEGNCNWSDTDVIGRTIGGFIENEENNYINREGKTIEGEQSKLTNFRVMQAVVSEPVASDDYDNSLIPGEEEMF